MEEDNKRGSSMLTLEGMKALREATFSGRIIRPSYYKASNIVPIKKNIFEEQILNKIKEGDKELLHNFFSEDNETYAPRAGEVPTEILDIFDRIEFDYEISPSLTSLASWKEGPISDYIRVDSNTIEYLIDIPLDEVEHKSRVFGLYLEDGTLFMVARPPYTFPAMFRQIFKVQLTYKETENPTSFRPLPEEETSLYEHKNNHSNPHNVTLSQLSKSNTIDAGGKRIFNLGEPKEAFDVIRIEELNQHNLTNTTEGEGVHGILQGSGNGFDADKVDGAELLQILHSKSYTHLIKIRSYGYNAGPHKSGVWINGNEAARGNRSYNLLIIDRDSGSISKQYSYDVFANPDQAFNLANHLKSCTEENIIILYTSDEPQGNHLHEELINQIERCGGTQLYSSDSFKYRSAYVLVGIPGSGYGNGVEFYSGKVDYDSRAIISTSLIISDGDIILGGAFNSRDAARLDGKNLEELVEHMGKNIDLDQAISREVNASEKSIADCARAQVNASYDSRAADFQSQVNCSDKSVAMGKNSQVNSSKNSLSRGDCSQVNASEWGKANTRYSGVTSSYSALSEHTSNHIISSCRVASAKDFTLCGGFATEGFPHADNRTWELDSVAGNLSLRGSSSSGFADYGEYFENKKRGIIKPGIIIALEKDKIREAKAGEDFIGVVSKTAAIRLGDTPFFWNKRFLTDEWGGLQYKKEKDPLWIPRDGETEDDHPLIEVPVENPDYIPEKKQIPRSQRPHEWTLVGLMGQVYVRCDKTVDSGDFIAPKTGGMGTKSEKPTRLKAMKITSQYNGQKKYAVAYCLLL